MNLTYILDRDDYLKHQLHYASITTGTYLIIPKTKIEDVKDIQAALKKLSENLKVDYSEELDWKWS
ncbi:MAG: hypothetical protein AAF348_09250 [Bacteroidota bacterium]